MRRVLFVDDEPLLLQGLKAGLYARRKDWEMQFAEGGAKALEIMAKFLADTAVQGATVLCRGVGQRETRRDAKSP